MLVTFLTECHSDRALLLFLGVSQASCWERDTLSYTYSVLAPSFLTLKLGSDMSITTATGAGNGVIARLSNAI